MDLPALRHRHLDLRAPVASDGTALWELACDAGGLDVNSPYSYHLWCRDFAASSVVAWADATPAGFITGYRRPSRDDCLFVWQVAVHPEQRGVGLGVAMLEALVARDSSIRAVEATVTPSNRASERMFERFAHQQAAHIERSTFLGPDQFPDGHEPEILLDIGPLRVCSQSVQPNESR